MSACSTTACPALLCFCNTLCTSALLKQLGWHPQHVLLANAAYGSDATHMVTEEALAERDAALKGDPGADMAVKVDMPPQPSMHRAKPVAEPAQPSAETVETQVGTICSLHYHPYFIHNIADCAATCCLRWSLSGHQLYSACTWDLSILLYFSNSPRSSQACDLANWLTTGILNQCCNFHDA